MVNIVDPGQGRFSRQQIKECKEKAERWDECFKPGTKIPDPKYLQELEEKAQKWDELEEARGVEDKDDNFVEPMRLAELKEKSKRYDEIISRFGLETKKLQTVLDKSKK
jgi:hypothetical protein